MLTPQQIAEAEATLEDTSKVEGRVPRVPMLILHCRVIALVAETDAALIAVRTLRLVRRHRLAQAIDIEATILEQEAPMSHQPYGPERQQRRLA